MNGFLYRGSGPGAPEACLFWHDPGSGFTDAFAPPGALWRFAALAAGRIVAIVIETEARAARLVAAEARPGAPAETVLRREGLALHEPLPGPNGRAIALLETPDGFYPSRADGPALLRVFVTDGAGWRSSGVQAEAMNAPIAWYPQGQAVAATDRKGRLIRVDLTGGAGVQVLAPRGRCPAVAADGALAYVDGKAVVILTPQGAVRRDLPGPATALCFDPEGGLIAACVVDHWRTDVVRLDPGEAKAHLLLSTSEVRWLAAPATRPPLFD